MTPDQINSFLGHLISDSRDLIGVIVGALLGYWLSGAHEIAKTRRVHRRAIRLIQSAYRPHQHSESVTQLEAWWPLAIDDCGRFKHWRLNKLRSSMRDIPTPIPDWDTNIESECTPEREASHNKRLDETRKQAMALFECIIETL